MVNISLEMLQGKIILLFYIFGFFGAFIDYLLIATKCYWSNNP